MQYSSSCDLFEHNVPSGSSVVKNGMISFLLKLSNIPLYAIGQVFKMSHLGFSICKMGQMVVAAPWGCRYNHISWYAHNAKNAQHITTIAWCALLFLLLLLLFHLCSPKGQSFLDSIIAIPISWAPSVFQACAKDLTLMISFTPRETSDVVLFSPCFRGLHWSSENLA